MLDWPLMSKRIAATVLGVLACASCSSHPPAPPPAASPRTTRVILLGFDGASPDFIGPLAAEGQLPAIRRLMDEGSYGALKSASPTKSAILWTSIATGKTMLKHGIIDWTYVDRMGLQVPYEDRARKVKTYWEILAERGITTGTLNWWMSYPPRPLPTGYIVSNAFRHEEEAGTVYPQRLHASLAPLRLNGTQAGTEMQRLGIPDWKEGDATVPMHAAKDVLDAYRLYVAQDLTVDRVADRLFKTEPVEVFSAYFRLVDVTSHFAVHFVDRKAYDEAVGLEKAGRLTPEARKRIDREFAHVLAPVYRLMDRTIQKYLDARDERTVLVVCSDHGFRFFRGNYAHAHKSMEPPEGVVFLDGPGVRKGRRIEGATIFDIAPTILHAMGQPVAADMDGGVLKDALGPGPAIRTIASYETASGSTTPAAPEREHTELDKDVLDDLKTLGYIGGADKESPPSPSPRP